MSALSRRAACSVARLSTSNIVLRSIVSQASPATTPFPDPTVPDTDNSKKPKPNMTPLPVPPTVFPPPADPWDVAPASQRSRPPSQHSPFRIRLAQFGAKMLGYNSKGSTSIRETARMMSGIVDAVERDSDFWYRECGLPSTYQTFFQLHLLYVLILLPRLRAIAPNVVARAASTSPAPPTESSASGTASSSTTGMLSKPSNVIYPAEILNHFFDLAETQMRRVLGRGERERVVKKYMEEMGQQWKGSGMAVDYSLGLGLSEDTAERGNADAELAAWLWRNLFDARGSVPLRPSTTDGGDLLSEGASDLDVPKHLEQVVWFMRREMKRLDGIPDEDVLVGNLGTWGPAGLGDQEQAV